MSELAMRLARPEILALNPYNAGSSSRDLIRLHTNEAPYSLGINGLNRYPDPQPDRLKARLADFYKVPARHLLLTRGSDDGIDLLVRCFCRPGIDGIVVCPPTFAMYAQAAGLQNANLRFAPLRRELDFELQVDDVLQACSETTRLVFVCSPNNPTGNVVPKSGIIDICEALRRSAIVVVDEAYIEFSGRGSVSSLVADLPNLVVLRTVSKALGLAGLRLGGVIASSAILDVLRRAQPPYPLPTPTINGATGALSGRNLAALSRRVSEVVRERERLKPAIAALACVRQCWPSQANFLLAAVEDVAAAMRRSRDAGILIRDVSAMPGLSDCIRITVGSEKENDTLIASLEGSP